MPVPPTGALRLASADFDAFLEPTTTASRGAGLATSQGAAAQRRALRERIEAWARSLLPRLVELGIPVEIVVPDEVEQHLSSGAPRAIAQRVLFVRDAFARSLVPRSEPELEPLRSHAHLALTIDSVHVAVSFELCPEAEADVKNVRARLADPTALLELTSLLESMPDEFAIGVTGVPSFPRAQSATPEDIRALLDNSERSRRPLWMGWSIKREIALANVDELDELMADALVALAHVYRQVAWAVDNDLIGATRRGAWRARRATLHEDRRERGREERRKRQQSAKRGPARKEGSRREREDEKRILTASERDAAIDTSKGSAKASAGELREREPLERFKDALERGGRAAALRRPMLPTSLRLRGELLGVDVDPSIPLEKGAKVRVLSGPFAGRMGVVEEIHETGRARVRLGLLAATLDRKDIAASTERARPKLASSHRRPRGARGR